MNLSNITAIGKYLDQPALVKKLTNIAPSVLITGATAYGIHDTYQAPPQERKKKFLKNLSVLSFTVVSAIIATKGLKIGKKQLIKGIMHSDECAKAVHNGKHHVHTDHCCSHHSGTDEVLEKIRNSDLLQEIKDKLSKIVEKVEKGIILKLDEVKFLKDKLKIINPKEKLIDEIIPMPHSHDPFQEIMHLSTVGAIPVIGGITGGVIGDKITNDYSEENFLNKLKEGFYQYSANIILCNVGAGIALYGMSKFGIQSKSAKLVGMLAGILAVGVLGGNAIANFISKNIFNPLVEKGPKQVLNTLKENHSKGTLFKDLNDERHPEALDICLHVDDFASAGFLSGLKCIGPILPILYSVSGYRAGIGYRNHKHHNKHHHNPGRIANYHQHHSELFKHFYLKQINSKAENHPISVIS